MWQVFLDGCSVLSENWSVALGAIGVTCLGCGLSFFLLRGTTREKTIPWQSGFLLIFFFVASVILRLAFVTETLVPPYFDSVEHFRLVNELVTALESSALLETIPTLTPGYYHLGFHFLAALLTLGLHADPINVILVLGQVILAAIPIPIFFLIRSKTQSNTAAYFGAILAGFGWYMPGFAVNWGKYPALAGLLVLELVLSLAYLIPRNKPGRNQTVSIVLLILWIIISTLFHSRTLIVIVISIASWIAAGKMQSLSKHIQYLLLGILLAAILVLGLLIQKEPLLALTLEPYLDNGMGITLTVLALSPFALIKFPRGVYFCILFIFWIFAALFISVSDWLPGFGNQTLLDRPFVEMLLYLPLSILGGLGAAGFLQFLNTIKAIPEQIRTSIRALSIILLIGTFSISSMMNYDFYPSDCCNFVRYDDTIAFDWLDRNTPPDARVLIASTQMHVLPSGPSEANVGTDAGIWIPALTDRITTFAPFGIDFRSPGTLEGLCKEQINYIYVGGTDQKFNAAQLQEKPDWYEGILFLPNAQVYQITGCTKL